MHIDEMRIPFLVLGGDASFRREPGSAWWMHKILRTGATGFIGKHLTALLKHGHELVCLVRGPKKLDADLAARMEVLRGDLALCAPGKTGRQKARYAAP